MELIPAEILNYAKELVQTYGYWAIFFIAFTESFINPIVPYPFIAGAHFFGLDIWLASIVAFIGNILGAIFTYLLGFKLGENWGKKILGEKREKWKTMILLLLVQVQQD